MPLDKEEIHYRIQFGDMIQELASSSPNRSLLKNLPMQENKAGSALFEDSIGNADDATSVDARSVSSRQKFEDGTAGFTEFKQLLTPQTDIIRSRTQLLPQEIKAGHTFARNVNIMSVVDPTNRTVNALMQDIFLREDRLVISALDAASTLRVDATSADEVSPVSVAMPSGQQYETANVGYIDVDDFDAILEKFETNYINSQKYILVSPTEKKTLVQNNRDVIKNGDFVTNRTFENGELPTINGFIPICSPLVTAGKFYAFVGEALLWNQFESMNSSLDRIELMMNALQVFMVENADCKRLDDKGVVQGTIKTS